MTCTDFGLIHSYDNGKTWVRNIGTVSYDYRNTCYDLEFDKNQKGVVYSIWCSLHDAPYYPNVSYLSCIGKFGISYDGGLTWQFKSIKSDNNILPYKLIIDYSNNKTTIYIASEGRGIFVSEDLGNTFTTLNNGLKYTNIEGQNAIFVNDLILTKKGMFVITSGLAPDENVGLYKLNEENNTFINIKLPDNVNCVRDICYSEKHDCLYIWLLATMILMLAYCVTKTTSLHKYLMIIFLFVVLL